MANASSPVVTSRTGALVGRVVDGVAAFLGIPYAAPPFGARRFQAPGPPASWSGTRNATSFGPTVPKGEYPAPSRPYFPEVWIPGEDCLNLNVWTPDPGARGLPVLVWIHGGSFMNGSGSLEEFDGTAFARSGLVCVTINYRLGADGFLFLDDGIANRGLLDQLAALRWVQENIAAFGGDPTRVTVAGESAGAMSIVTLLSMPESAGLFARAIAQSGAAAHVLSPEQGRMVTRYLCKSLGIAPTREAVSAVPVDTLVRAAAALVDEVQTAPDPAKWGALAASLLPFAPTLDGTVVREAPLAAFAAGRSKDVPLLIGTNRDEARLILVGLGQLDVIDEAMLAGAAQGYGLGPAAIAAYRDARPGASAGDILADVVTDWFFRVPCIRVAEARAAAGAPNTWVYRFDHPAPESNGRLGACHGIEMPFVFRTIDRPALRARLGPAPSTTVSETLHRTWVAFASEGTPGWRPYDVETRATGLLAEHVCEAPDPAARERVLWDGIR